MSKYINLGYNFDRSLVTQLAEINKRCSNDCEPYIGQAPRAITSVYGSDRAHAWLSARPDFRLPDISLDEFEWHVKALSAIGIEFNYTMNSPYPGSKDELQNARPHFISWCCILQEIGVKRFIISNPILIEFLRRDAPHLDVKLELSTIMHVDTPMQLIAYKKLDERVDRVVGNILYNRDFRRLRAFVHVCEQIEVDYEVMVNEFCLNGSGHASEAEKAFVKLDLLFNFKAPDASIVPRVLEPSSIGDALAAHCVFRDSCYACHAENKTKEEAKLFNNYPMSKCMSSKAHSATDWLRTFTARPQDLHFYEEIGIHHFKVTGRTAKTPYVLKMAEAYLTGEYSGNLLELWKPLETIYSEKDELTEHKHQLYVPAEHLDGFFNAFADETINCAELLCTECRWCDDNLLVALDRADAVKELAK